MQIRLPHILVAAAVIVVILPIGAAKLRYTESQRNQRKADYIAMEAMNHRANSADDAYFALMEYAATLAPTDLYLQREDAMRTLLENTDDSVTVAHSLSRIKRYLVSEPTDQYAWVSYATLCSRAGLYGEALEAWEHIYRHSAGRPEVAGLYGDALAATGAHDNLLRAIDVYNAIDTIEGITPTTSTRRMRIYHALGDTAAISSEISRLVVANPHSVQYLTMAGSAYQELNMLDSALTYFNRAVETDPSSGIAQYYRANYYSAVSDSAAYDSAVFNALAMYDLDLQPKLGILYEYVRKLYADSTQTPRIRSMFHQLIEQYPHEASVRNLYADYLTTLHDYTGAVEQLSYEVDADPSDVKRWHTLGSLQFLLKRYTDAIATVDHALHYHPSSTDLYQLGSSAAAAIDSFTLSRSYIQHALERVDSVDYHATSQLYTTMGDVLYRQGITDSSYMYYNRAIDLDPANLLAMNNCAYHMACQEQDLMRALDMIQSVVARRPGDITSIDTYAWVLFKLKRYSEARTQIDIVLQSVIDDPDDDASGEIYEHAGDIYFMDGDPERAVEFWKEALRLDPDNKLLQRKVKNKTYFYR